MGATDSQAEAGPCEPRRDASTGTAYLRRLARAHATGEMSVDEYRRKRRAFIEAHASGMAPARDDMTVPRSSLPALEERMAAESGVAPASARWPGWRWLFGMPLSVMLLVICATDGSG
jgi:hypothetical protein